MQLPELLVQPPGRAGTELAKKFLVGGVFVAGTFQGGGFVEDGGLYFRTGSFQTGKKRSGNVPRLVFRPPRR
ncbi:MAG: hypothetical protein WBA17_15590 [Saprospiraceae bacterium]